MQVAGPYVFFSGRIAVVNQGHFLFTIRLCLQVMDILYTPEQRFHLITDHILNPDIMIEIVEYDSNRRFDITG